MRKEVQGSSHVHSWLNREITDLVTRAPENKLIDFDGMTIFDRPLVGVADGDSPLFQIFRRAVSSRHILPRELLTRYAPKDADLTSIRVISWILPFSDPIRRSNRDQAWPSQLYSLARNNGGALNYRLSQRLRDACQEKGIAALSPMITEEYDAFRVPVLKFSSTWSERHVAYAAGLGCFGLNGSLITPLGSNVRLGSLITNLELPPIKVDATNFPAPCLKSEGRECAVCVQRCPVGAISGGGLDKLRCNAMRKAVRRRQLPQYTQEMHMLSSPIVKNGERREGYSLGCALCQCGVPCEKSDPFRENKG